VSVGLGLGGRVGGQRCSKVAEARRRDDPKPGGRQPPAQLEPLIEAASRTVDDEHSRPVALFGVLDRPTTCRGEAAFRDPRARVVDRGAELRVGPDAQANDQDGGGYAEDLLTTA
jgi:hypothetical protein